MYLRQVEQGVVGKDEDDVDCGKGATGYQQNGGFLGCYNKDMGVAGDGDGSVLGTDQQVEFGVCKVRRFTKT